MKKILFILPSLNCGGVEKSFINLINSNEFKIKSHKYEFYFKVLNEEGVYYIDIPKYFVEDKWNSNILNIFYTFKKSISILLKTKQYNLLFRRLIGAFLKYLLPYTQDQIFWRIFKKYIPQNSVKYDVAIAYAESRCTYYLVDKIDADYKIAWIHTDHKIAKFNFNFDRTYYKHIDKVCCVSEDLLDISKSFIEVDKLELIHNLLPIKEILKLSSHSIESVEFTGYGGNKLITISRISKEKNITFIIKIAKQLKKMKFDFKWYIVGNGKLKKRIASLIQRLELNNELILLGEQKNPYKYLKRSDLYVQTSKYEGFSTTIMEAIVLNKMIFTSKVSGVNEQIKLTDNIKVLELDYSIFANEIKKFFESEKNITKNKLDNYNDNTINNFFLLLEGKSYE